MKILIVWSKWHADLGGGYERAFAAAGHQTSVFDDRPPHWSLWGLKVARRLHLPLVPRFFLSRYQRFVNHAFTKMALRARPDFIFVVRGTFFTARTITRLKDALKIPILNWIIDDPKKINRLEPQTLLVSYPAYTRLCVVDRAWLSSLRGECFTEALYLPHAADARSYHPLSLGKGVDVFFVGSVSLRYPNTEAGEARLRVLAALCRAGVSITAVAPGIGEALSRFPELERIKRIDRYVPSSEVNEWYNRSRIVLNLNAPQLITDFSDRLAAISLSGAFQLVDDKSQIVELMGEQARAWTFNSEDDLIQKIRYYLAHEAEREQYARSAYERALSAHTYESRVKTLLAAISHYVHQ